MKKTAILIIFLVLFIFCIPVYADGTQGDKITPPPPSSATESDEVGFMSCSLADAIVLWSIFACGAIIIAVNGARINRKKES